MDCNNYVNLAFEVAEEVMAITGPKLKVKMSSSNLKTLLKDIETVKGSIPESLGEKEVEAYHWGVDILMKSQAVYAALDPVKGEEGSAPSMMLALTGWGKAMGDLPVEIPHDDLASCAIETAYWAAVNRSDWAGAIFMVLCAPVDEEELCISASLKDKVAKDDLRRKLFHKLVITVCDPERPSAWAFLTDLMKKGLNVEADACETILTLLHASSAQFGPEDVQKVEKALKDMKKTTFALKAASWVKLRADVAKLVVSRITNAACIDKLKEGAADRPDALELAVDGGKLTVLALKFVDYAKEVRQCLSGSTAELMEHQEVKVVTSLIHHARVQVECQTLQVMPKMHHAQHAPWHTCIMTHLHNDKHARCPTSTMTNMHYVTHLHHDKHARCATSTMTNMHYEPDIPSGRTGERESGR